MLTPQNKSKKFFLISLMDFFGFFVQLSPPKNWIIYCSKSDYWASLQNSQQKREIQLRMSLFIFLLFGDEFKILCRGLDWLWKWINVFGGGNNFPGFIAFLLIIFLTNNQGVLFYLTTPAPRTLLGSSMTVT